MPKVGDKEFAYTPEGVAEARKESTATGIPMSDGANRSVTEYAGGGKVGYDSIGRYKEGGKVKLKFKGDIESGKKKYETMREYHRKEMTDRTPDIEKYGPDKGKVKTFPENVETYEHTGKRLPLNKYGYTIPSKEETAKREKRFAEGYKLEKHLQQKGHNTGSDSKEGARYWNKVAAGEVGMRHMDKKLSVDIKKYKKEQAKFWDKLEKDKAERKKEAYNKAKKK